MWKFANPTVFLAAVARTMPWLIGVTVILFAIGLAGWTVMSVSAIGALVWRHPLAEVAMKAAAPIGAAFTFACLVTGSLWGKPMWGTWWQWDARMTSVLILFI